MTKTITGVVKVPAGTILVDNTICVRRYCRVCQSMVDAPLVYLGGGCSRSDCPKCRGLDTANLTVCGQPQEAVAVGQGTHNAEDRE